MTESTTILGGVIEPRDVTVAFPPLYSGPASARDHRDYTEVAFFTPLTSPRRPSQGQIDGMDVTVIKTMTRALNPDVPGARARDAIYSVVMHVITATPE